MLLTEFRDYIQTEYGFLHGLITKDRFVLLRRLEVLTRIKGQSAVSEDGHVHLKPDGRLIILIGFKWDGASGPTWDTGVTMRASCVHDAIYRLIAEGKLPKKIRWKADGLLWYIMRDDGANWFRATYYLAAVEAFGGWHV